MLFGIYLSFIVLLADSLGHALMTLPLRRNSDHLEAQTIRMLQNTTENITNWEDVRYTVSVSIGSQGQAFNLLLDTGTGYTWIPISGTSGFKNTFNPESSTTSTFVGSSLQEINFYLFETNFFVRGYYYMDTFNWGGLQVSDFQYLLIINSNVETKYQFDGIIGMAYSPYCTFLLDALKDQGQISSRVFGVWVGNDMSSLGMATGELAIGGYNSNYSDSSFSWVAASPNSAWSVSITSYTFAGVSFQAVNPVALVNSGQGYISVPPSSYTQLLSAVQSSGHSCTYNQNYEAYICQCSNSNLPTTQIEFSGFQLQINSEIYFPSIGNNECLLMLAEGDGVTEINFGDVLLRSYYTVFDADNSRIGFATYNAPTSSNLWVIIVIIVAAVIFLVLVAVAVRYYMNWKERKRKEQMEEDKIKDFEITDIKFEERPDDTGKKKPKKNVD